MLKRQTTLPTQSSLGTKKVSQMTIHGLNMLYYKKEVIS